MRGIKPRPLLINGRGWFVYCRCGWSVKLKMSFVQVRPSSGGGSQSLVAERTPFFGARVPEEVKLMYKALKSADEGTVKKIFKCTLESCLIANIETILMSLFFSKCYLYTTLLFFSLTLSIFSNFLPLSISCSTVS